MRRPPRPLNERRPKRAHVSAEQLASLSHEFRTPLNGVIGMARLLEGTRLTAEQRAYVLALRESGEHLLTLVNDVLDFAKLAAGRVDLHDEPIETEGLLRSVAELLSPRAREKGLEIAWTAPPSMAEIDADESRLKQVLLNFAGNAVKFAQTGGVLIAAEHAEDGRVRFTVEDTGPGVTPAERHKIFEAFAQAELGRAEVGGAGLGLAIARRLAQAMGGEIGVETRRGGGAVFWFEAPIRTRPPAEGARTLAGRRVGIVSPNTILRDAARRQVLDCAGEAWVAVDLEDARRRAQPGDVLLIDHALEPLKRRWRAEADCPAIVLLPPDERERMDAYRRAGVSGYLIKPLRRASLVERVLIAAGEEPDVAAAPDDDRIATAAAPGARILLVEDNPINALLARALLTREGCEVDHATGGADALAAAKVGTYDLILMDMRMPGMSGEEAARALRAMGVTAPIVALTANAFEEDRRLCLAAGMNDFLVKPLSPDALRAMLTRWASRGWTGPTAQAKLA
ncbi:MAG: response regulator [Phenylobacterium sp.]|nr:MAG: response regulator [Phenylobacterium sp.]